MTPLETISWMRLLTVPRPPDEADAVAWMTAEVLPSITAAHCALVDAPAPGLFAVGWVRLAGSQDVEVVLGLSTGLTAWGANRPAGGVRPLPYPPGAMGEPWSRPSRWFEHLGRWLRCEATPRLRDPGEPPAGPAARSRAFDDYAAQFESAFAWLVVAESMTVEAVDAEAAQIATEVTALRRRESSEEHRIELERSQSRYRELARARQSGLWNVHVLAGGEDSTAARRTAALLCGGTALANIGWTLTPTGLTGSVDEVWASTSTLGEPSGASPFMASSELVAGLARPPVRELPGIRLVAPYRFDVTPEVVKDAAGPELGAVLDNSQRPVGTLRVPHETLNRHSFVCGATGSGKSQTTRALLEALTRSSPSLPWLVVEPAKSEYARMAGRLVGHTEVLVIRPGDLDSWPASLNPLSRSRGSRSKAMPTSFAPCSSRRSTPSIRSRRCSHGRSLTATQARDGTSSPALHASPVCRSQSLGNYLPAGATRRCGISSPRPGELSRRLATAGNWVPTSAASSTFGSEACGSARLGASLRAVTRWTSRRC